MDNTKDKTNTSNPEYKGFCLHIQEANSKGLPIDRAYLNYLADMYNTPVPNTPEWDNENLPSL